MGISAGMGGFGLSPSICPEKCAGASSIAPPGASLACSCTHGEALDGELLSVVPDIDSDAVGPVGDVLAGSSHGCEENALELGDAVCVELDAVVLFSIFFADEGQVILVFNYGSVQQLVQETLK